MRKLLGIAVCGLGITACIIITVLWWGGLLHIHFNMGMPVDVPWLYIAMYFGVMWVVWRVTKYLAAWILNVKPR